MVRKAICKIGHDLARGAGEVREAASLPADANARPATDIVTIE